MNKHQFLKEDMEYVVYLSKEIKYWDKRCVIRLMDKEPRFYKLCRFQLKMLIDEKIQEKGRIINEYGREAVSQILGKSKN